MGKEVVNKMRYQQTVVEYIFCGRLPVTNGQ